MVEMLIDLSFFRLKVLVDSTIYHDFFFFNGKLQSEKKKKNQYRTSLAVSVSSHFRRLSRQRCVNRERCTVGVGSADHTEASVTCRLVETAVRKQTVVI